jgi:hypothetical protein
MILFTVSTVHGLRSHPQSPAAPKLKSDKDPYALYSSLLDKRTTICVIEKDENAILIAKKEGSQYESKSAQV